MTAQYLKRMDLILDHLPWYVLEFIQHKRNLTAATKLNYVTDFTFFFTWVCEYKYFTGGRRDVTLEILNQLRVNEINAFISFLENLGNTEKTISRKISSLKSLFRFLIDVAEHEDLTPYLTRNVITKIEIERDKTDVIVKATKIRNSIIVGDEFEKFRLFVGNEYAFLPNLHRTAKRFHELNREHDTAIVSLFLGSGIRLSEFVGLDIQNINLENNTVEVVRKGGKKDFVRISDISLLDVRDYISIRKKRYKPAKNMNALFIPSPESIHHSEGRLKDRSVKPQ